MYPHRALLMEKRSSRKAKVTSIPSRVQAAQPEPLSASIHPVSLITNLDSELQSTSTFLQFRFYSYNVVSLNI
jgi:hypothetical protein